jgi:predicted permease
MSRLKGFVARVRALLQPRAAAARMDEEFAFHVEMEAERLRAQGVPDEHARRQALARFGGLERYRQEMREGRRANWLVDLQQDIRYGARMLLKQRGVTIIAILSLALGIGANTAIFSIANALLYRSRPVSDPDRLVQIYTSDSNQEFQTSSYPSYEDFRDRNSVLEDLAAYGLGWQFRLGTAGEVEQVWGEVVSGNYFDVLGITPQRGRWFLAEEDAVRGRNPVVVIGHGLWQRRFQADAGIIGRTIVVNRQPLTVIGIAPASFGGMMAGWSTELWVPVSLLPSLDPSRGPALLTRRSKWLTMVGRVKKDVSLAQVRSQFDALTAAIRAEHPDEWRRERNARMEDQRVTVLPERKTRIPPGLLVPVAALAGALFVVVNLVLAIACLNLASLLYARGVARRGEIAVRLAMGAGRLRIIRQLLTESVLMALVAGAAALLLGSWALDAILAALPALPEGIRVGLDVGLDWRVALYGLTFALLTGVLFGLAPAAHASRFPVAAVLKNDALAFSGPTRTSRSRRALIITQVALSVVLLIASGLMTRSLRNAQPTQLGFPSNAMLVAPVSLDENEYDRTRSLRFHERLIGDVGSLPGVLSVSVVHEMPGGFMGGSRSSTEIEGYSASADEDLEIASGIVGPSYFTNLKIPIVLGRDFDLRDRDGAPCVAIINEAFALRYIGAPVQSVGKRLARFYEEGKRMCEIVGVVRDDAWQTLNAAIKPFYWVPLLQSDWRSTMLLVHTSGDPAQLKRVVRQAIQTLDAHIPVDGIQTLDEYFEAARLPFQLAGLLIGACGLLALILAAIGIYGTVAWSVAQRSREVGIRMALGAERADILRVVIRQGMAVVSWGLVLGLFLGVMLAQVLVMLPLPVPVLFGISPLDPVTYAGVAIGLGLVGLAACFLPARRASRLDPGTTLRTQ